MDRELYVHAAFDFAPTKFEEPVGVIPSISLREFKERNYICWEMSSLALSYLLSCGEPPILIQRRQPWLPYDCVTPAVAA